MPKKLAVYKMIDGLRERYYQQSPGKESLLKILSEVEVAEHVYNSNAIENSTLTLEETDKILLEIDLDRYISERELFEAKNLARVVEYIDVKAKEQELTKDMILLLHKMLITNIKDDIAGRFRSEKEYVRVGSYIAPPPHDVDDLLTQMFTTYHASASEHVIKRIALLHLTFERIHPFVDGNGRIGRVMNNYVLIREGFVPINIAFIDRQTYYGAFHEFDDRGDTALMEELVGRALTNSYHKRLAYLESKRIIPLKAYAKEAQLSLPNLINKAKRQTIPAFRERGVWKIGV